MGPDPSQLLLDWRSVVQDHGPLMRVMGRSSIRVVSEAISLTKGGKEAHDAVIKPSGRNGPIGAVPGERGNQRFDLCRVSAAHQAGEPAWQGHGAVLSSEGKKLGRAQPIGPLDGLSGQPG